MTAYYNEFDPKAAAWLRELINQGHIADGVVDERSIEDVRPDELMGYTQCHFFAGIGVWSYALRRAGWADDRPVWTGSCPCQPFSAAGKGAGFDDERHLWPAFHHLISQCRPDVVLGEQVASKDGLAWLDLVQSDLEATGYANGAVDLCAAGIGAPHIRQRLWWVGTRVADAVSPRLQGREWRGPTGTQGRPSGYSAECSGPGGMADTSGQHLRGELGSGNGKASAPEREAWQRERGWDNDSLGGADGGMADTYGGGHAQLQREGAGRMAEWGDEERPRLGHEHGVINGGLADTESNGWHEGESFIGRGAEGIREGGSIGCSSDGADGSVADTASRGHMDPINGSQRGQGVEQAQSAGGSISVQSQRPSATNGHWRDADWLFCRDGKWRPVEPGTSPLVNGAAARVGRLRGYGNAIVAQAAQAFIESVMD